MSISLFEGFSRRYQVRLAQAEHDKQVASLDSVRQRAALEAWSSYQALKVAFETVAQSKALLRHRNDVFGSDGKALSVGCGKHAGGVARARALADSRQRRVEAISDWSRQRGDLAPRWEE
ncbi:TolC family protein [Burkholderia gladioli]|uniref:TolC family protein n=1 Tax=Burkholderia gladioli TaxID=28095 RepID=UPI00202E9A6B|nr:TolC family protein [Burkholderia gladioli]URV26555.1 TolC family protein [Burkholderia gladioli]